MRTCCLFLFFSLCLPLTASSATKFRYPMSTSGTYITAYYDQNRASGKLKDWNGGRKTYDNHSGSDYGVGSWPGMNRGVDIYAGADGKVVAAVDGQSDRCTSGKCSPCNGNYVKLRHSDGKYSYYLHMKRGTVKVRVGATVKCGTLIGQVGSSGCSSGPHLHFQVNHSSARDPFAHGDWVSRGAYLGKPSTTCQNGSTPPGPQPSTCTYVKTRKLGTSSLRIRSSSSTSTKVLGNVTNGVCLKVLGKTTSGQSISGSRIWYKISYKGATGWIAGYYAGCSTCGGSTSECSGSQRQACYTGLPSTRKRGNCRDGVRVCSGGKWGNCSGDRKPQTERCDGQDNDCDGSIDEGSFGGQSCSTGKPGVCGQGKFQCRSGRLQCVASSSGTSERCDGKDNDCDGKIDEGNPGGGGVCSTGGSGSCGQGSKQCRSGRLQCVGGSPSSIEICDAKDNNCNGKIDDGLSRNCYSGPANTNGSGICKGGRQACSNGQWGTCNGEVKPLSKETCNNGKDDNCDGRVDEDCSGSSGQCKAGAQRGCYEGPANTNGVGSCKGGTQSCVNGLWGACKGQLLPTAELCKNTQDDDCDGDVDENCTIPEKCEDEDGDGFGVGKTCKKKQDCNDQDKNIFPGAEDICGNSIDEDCEGGDLSCGKLRLGQAGCRKTEDCSTNVCVKHGGTGIHRCSQKCSAQEACPSDFNCVGAEGKQACWPKKKTKIPDGDFVKKCSADSACPSEQYCDRGFCAKKKGCGCQTERGGPIDSSWLFALLLIFTLGYRRRQKKSLDSL